MTAPEKDTSHVTYARYYFLTDFGPQALCTGCFNQAFTSQYLRPNWEKFPQLTLEEYLAAVVMTS